MSFWVSTSVPVYKAAGFTNLGQPTHDWIVNGYHSHNILFLVSAFGPWRWKGSDYMWREPHTVNVANNLATFVK